MNERDDALGALYDAAQSICPVDDCDAWEEERVRQEWDREQRLFAALDALVKGGIDKEHIRTLAFECGAIRWSLEKSIKREPTWFKEGDM